MDIDSPKRPRRSSSDENIRPPRKILKYDETDSEGMNIVQNQSDQDGDENRFFEHDTYQSLGEHDSDVDDCYNEVIVHDDVQDQGSPWCIDVSLSEGDASNSSGSEESEDDSDVTITPESVSDDNLLKCFEDAIAKYSTDDNDCLQKPTDDEYALNNDAVCGRRRKKKQVRFRDPLDDNGEKDYDNEVFYNYTIEESFSNNNDDLMLSDSLDVTPTTEEECFRYLDNVITEDCAQEPMDLSEEATGRESDEENDTLSSNVISIEDVVDDAGNDVIDEDVANNSAVEMVNYGVELENLTSCIDKVQENKDADEELWKANFIPKFRQNIRSPRRRISPKMRKLLEEDALHGDEEDGAHQEPGFSPRPRRRRKRPSLEQFISFYSDHAYKEETAGHSFHGVDKHGDQVLIKDIGEEEDVHDANPVADVPSPESEVIDLVTDDTFECVVHESVPEQQSVELDQVEVCVTSDDEVEATKDKENIKVKESTSSENIENKDSTTISRSKENNSKNPFIKFLGTLACCIMCPSSYFVQYN